ncbi:MAG: hypothetical protein Q8R53_00215 [Nanoarchaeota archaeon]|nr:hypothetical protein [Nanoarchaeota archaeon]
MEYIIHNDPVEVLKGRFERAAEKAAIILYSPELGFNGHYFIPPQKVWTLYNVLLNHRLTPIQTVNHLGLEKIEDNDAESLANQWTTEGFRQRFDSKEEEREREKIEERRSKERRSDEEREYRRAEGRWQNWEQEKKAILRERRKLGNGLYVDEHGWVRGGSINSHVLLMDESRGLGLRNYCCRRRR